MTTKKQQIEQEEIRAATAIIIRALILAVIVALAVSVAPVASAGTSKKPPSQTFIEIGTTGDARHERDRHGEAARC